jgi:hypothetical protein
MWTQYQVVFKADAERTEPKRIILRVKQRLPASVPSRGTMQWSTEMTIVPRLILALAVCALPGMGLAQDTGVVAVESVISANPATDGKTYSLALKLQDGRQLSLQIPPAEGRFVLIQPRITSGPILPLAIPIEGVDGFLQLLQQKSVEAKTNAAKQHN